MRFSPLASTRITPTIVDAVLHRADHRRVDALGVPERGARRPPNSSEPIAVQSETPGPEASGGDGLIGALAAVAGHEVRGPRRSPQPPAHDRSSASDPPRSCRRPRSFAATERVARVVRSCSELITHSGRQLYARLSARHHKSTDALLNGCSVTLLRGRTPAQLALTDFPTLLSMINCRQIVAFRRRLIARGKQ